MNNNRILSTFTFWCFWNSNGANDFPDTISVIECHKDQHLALLIISVVVISVSDVSMAI